jgi:hypothetical protein
MTVAATVAPGSLHQQVGPMFSLPKGLVPFACIASVLPFWSPGHQVNPKTSTACRIFSLMIGEDSGSLYLTSRPQNYCCPQAWILHACSSCHGSW